MSICTKSEHFIFSNALIKWSKTISSDNFWKQNQKAENISQQILAGLITDSRKNQKFTEIYWNGFLDFIPEILALGDTLNFSQ